MIQLNFKNGLLYTDITLTHEGKSIVVKDLIIDTGASHTIIHPDYLVLMDVGFCDNDTIVKASGYGGTVEYSVRKLIDNVSLGNISISNIKLDFGEIDPYERVNGLLGLDFLKEAKVVIDLSDDAIILK